MNGYKVSIVAKQLRDTTVVLLDQVDMQQLCDVAMVAHWV